MVPSEACPTEEVRAASALIGLLLSSGVPIWQTIALCFGSGSGPVAADMALAVNVAAGQSPASKVAGRLNECLRIYGAMLDDAVFKSTVRVHTAKGTQIIYMVTHLFTP